MDSGMAAMSNRNEPRYGANSKLQMRNQLLQSDIGSIDITQEVPNGPQPPQQYPIYDSHHAMNDSQRYFPQKQYPGYMQGTVHSTPHQSPINRGPQLNRMGAPMTSQMGQPLAYNQGFQRSGGPVRQDPYSYEQPERRAHSLNQKALSSFFKQKGPRFAHAKSKHHGSKEDDDEDVMIEEGGESTLTFNDIRTLGNRGGDRYGHGSDTAPMIPTLITREHDNMNNVEYRKHMTSQRKLAMNALNKQNGGIMPPEGRAMSLQSYSSGSPFAPQRISPFTHGQGVPNNNSVRANSLMRGPPPLQQLPQQKQMNGYSQHGIIPGYNPIHGEGPRSMSLMTPQARPQQLNMISQQSRQENAALSSQPPSTMYMQSGKSSSSEHLLRLGQSRPPMPSSSTSGSSNSSNQSFSIPIANRSSSSNSENDYGAHITSPLKKEVKSPSLPVEKGHLSVLKLSTPQQNELIEKERMLALKEKELKEKERLIREQQAMLPGASSEKESGSLEVVKANGSLADMPRREKDLLERGDYNDAEADVSLNPLAELQTGLSSLSLDGKESQGNDFNRNRVSTSTFMSAFSDSPQKENKFKKSTGLYKLENNNTNSAFVTAQEFPNENEKSTDLGNVGTDLHVNHSTHTSTDTVNDGNSTLKDSVQEESLKGTKADRNPETPEGVSKKRSSFVKAKNFLRKMSSGSIAREKDRESQPSLKKNPSNVSMDSFPSSNNDTFQYRTQRRNSNNRASMMSTPSAKWINDQNISCDSSQGKAKLQNINVASDPDGFVFDNTLGKPYPPLFAGNDNQVDVGNFKTITISGEQLNILNENKELMQEITLVSTELAESIKRETILESQLQSLSPDQDFANENNLPSLAEFEIELRRKSSKIVELIQQLNDERLKRFIAEEQLLLQENGMKPSSLELVDQITKLNAQLREKDAEIRALKEEAQNYQT